MRIEEIKDCNNSFWLNFLREKSRFDTDKIEDMILSLIKEVEFYEKSQKELEYRLLNNFIERMSKTYRKRNCNWIIVQDFLQQGTSESGSNSSVKKCIELGINPYKYDLKREM